MATLLSPRQSHGAELNLAAVTCSQYENEMLASTMPGYKTDPIDTVMWLFGFSVAKSGERVMYGDSLTAFGFALDAKCKSSPDATLLEAVSSVKSKRENPMDLTRLDCATFETRHLALQKSDPESATTLTMWLFGYAVGASGSRQFDAGAVAKFDSSLNEWCTDHPGDSLFDALSAPNRAVPKAVAPKSATPKASPPTTHAPKTPAP
ncbi:MAG TPA: HdeA/HdeB family chaperone [Steroidobacteraceae bacterium]|nr:HdeA/HdeB family chaperone [Steroidobacteraceae bacterium]